VLGSHRLEGLDQSVERAARHVEAIHERRTPACGATPGELTHSVTALWSALYRERIFLMAVDLEERIGLGRVPDLDVLGSPPRGASSASRDEDQH
jgi:hypothetical protein